MSQAMTGMIQDWLMQYPWVVWGLTHPLLSMGSFVVLLFLLGGLLRAASRLTEVLWIRLLQLPFQGGRWLMAGVLNLLKLRRPLLPPLGFAPQIEERSPNGHPDMDSTFVSLSTTHQQQLYDIMVRLEGLQQAQTLLLQDIKALILTSQSPLVQPTRRQQPLQPKRPF